jgi:hypothetical protein
MVFHHVMAMNEAEYDLGRLVTLSAVLELCQSVIQLSTNLKSSNKWAGNQDQVIEHATNVGRQGLLVTILGGLRSGISITKPTQRNREAPYRADVSSNDLRGSVNCQCVFVRRVMEVGILISHALSQLG